MIALAGVSKAFGAARALHDVSFSVGAGEVVGFVGPNGAGKTTTLRLISGYLSPDAGTIAVDGIDVERDRRAACARIGYLPETVPLYREMRVADYLAFRARLKGVARNEVEAQVERALERTHTVEVRRRPIGVLSRGFRQRVGLADALVASPPVLLLDEPTAGLDPVQVREFRELLADLAGTHTVLLSSHILPEIEAVTDRVVMLAGGQVVADGDPAALRESAGLGAEASFEEVFIALAAGSEEPR